MDVPTSADDDAGRESAAASAPTAADSEPREAPAAPDDEQDDSWADYPTSVAGQAVSEEGDVPQAGPKRPNRRNSRSGPKPKPKGTKKSALRPADPMKVDDPGATALVPPPAQQKEAETDGTSSCHPGHEAADAEVAGSTDRLETDNFDLPLVLEFASTFGYGLHPTVLKFPPMSALQFDALCASIRREGRLHVDIVTWQKKIIDGMHRLCACLEEGITPTFREWDGRGSLVEYVASLNATRRHLKSGQRAATAVELLPLLEAEAKDRQRLHGGTTRGRGGSLPERIPGVMSEGEAREHAACLCGVNPHYVSDLKSIKELDHTLYDQVRAGQLTIPKAVEALKSRQQQGPATDAGGCDEHQDAGQCGGVDGSSTPETPAPAEPSSNSPAAREPAAPEGAKPQAPRKPAAPRSAPARHRANDPSAPPESGQASSTDGPSVAGGPPGDDTAPPQREARDCEASPQGRTPEWVDQLFAQAEQSLVRLTELAGDAEARNCIQRLGRKRREEHRAILLAVSNLLPRLLALLNDSAET